MDGDYDGDEAYEDGNGNLSDGVEGREEVANEELLSPFQEQKEKEEKEESAAMVAKTVHTVSRSDDKYPLHLSPNQDRKYTKGPFTVENEETPKLPQGNFPWVDPINSLNHKVGFCQPLSPAVQEAGDEEEKHLLNGERKQEVQQWPLPAVVSAPNTAKAAPEGRVVKRRNSIRDKHLCQQTVTIEQLDEHTHTHDN